MRARAAGTRRRPLRLPSTRPPLRRIFWTLGQLRAGRVMTANDVAERFSVGPRTVYRDMDFIRDEMRAPVEYDPGRRTWWLTEPSAVLPPILLSEGELMALYFAEKVLDLYRGTPYEKDLTG